MRNCPACGANGGRPAGVKSDFPFVRCGTCATLYTPNIPAGESLHSLYADYYGEANLTAPEFVSQRLDEIAATFAPYRKNNRLLDVGFGAGTLLHAAKRAGWNAGGTEASERAVAQAAAQGFDVRVCVQLTDARYDSASFDVVTAVELLEHIIDPSALLREIARILRPGGLLWATTPHGRGISARLLGTKWSVVSPPEHLQLFSVRGMRQLLGRAGLRPLHLATHGVNPYEIAHCLFHKDQPFDRVATSYALNAALSERPSRRALKNALNRMLSATRLGDGLKVYAVAGEESPHTV